MNLWLANHLVTNRITIFDFYRAAHYWKFGTHIPWYSADVAAYFLCGALTVYVVDYIKHIQDSKP